MIAHDDVVVVEYGDHDILLVIDKRPALTLADQGRP